MTAKDLLKELRQSGVLKTPLIISAFEKIDRKEFVPESCLKEAYEDYPLPIGFDQTISQPWTVAFMLELLQPQPGEKILDIGSGSGYTTALIAHIVSNQGNSKSEALSSKQARSSKIQNIKGKVVAIEVLPELCKFGRQNSEKYSFVSEKIAEFICADGSAPLTTSGLFDKILVSAALSKKELPQAWKDQLKVNGRIVCPIMSSVWIFDKISESEFKEKEYSGFSFVPLTQS